MSRRFLALTICIILIVGLVPSVQGQDEGELIPFNVGTGTAINHVVHFAAVDRGVFEAHGLDVQITQFPTGVEMVNALESGDVDVATFGSIPMLVAVSNDIPLRLIAYGHGDPNRAFYNDNSAVVAGRDSGVGEGDIAALDGKTVGLPIGTAMVPYLTGLLEDAGVDPENVEFVNIGPPDLAIALEQENVDAIAIWEGIASTILVNVEGSQLVIRGSSPTWFDPGTEVTTQSVIDENPEALERYLAAIAESAQWVRQNPEEAAEIATIWITGLDLDVALSSLPAPKLDIRMSRLTYEGYDNITIPFLLAQGNIDEQFPASEVVYPDLLLEVMDEFPEYFDDLEPIAEENQIES